MKDEDPTSSIEEMKTSLKLAIKDFYVGGNENALLNILSITQDLIKTMKVQPDIQAETLKTDFIIPKKNKEAAVLKSSFFDYCKTMRMSYSYKPILITAVIEYGNDWGFIDIDDAVQYFRKYYKMRREKGLKIEKGNCIYQCDCISDTSIAENIISNPVKALTASEYFFFDTTSNMFGFCPDLWTTLSIEDKNRVKALCQSKLEHYYSSK
ncbi:MAG: hypothetical protein AB9895_00625 [Negativicutes bacterium]